jgi:TonB family protein
MADAPTRHGRGLLVVIGLAVVFFILLGLIVVRAGRSGPEQVRPTETLTVLPVRIRIRTEPNARAAVVATATSGESLILIEDRGAWVRVQNRDGLSGWAERSNLEKTVETLRRQERYAAIRRLPPLKGIATDRSQLYSGPGIFYPLVGEVSEGSDVVVYTRDHDFYAIGLGEGIAYAGIDAIDVSSSGTRQLDVQTSSTGPATSETETAAPPSMAETPLEPPPLTPPPVTEEPIEPTTGVYSAVPPGGTQPEELDRVVPRYPGSARRAGVQGAVVVRGIVRKDGTIDNVEVIKDLPQGLGEAARSAVSRWRFRPATFRGEPIDVYYTVTVNFRLQ